jgi:hypothetical protein
MKLDAETARILLALFIAFHNLDVGATVPDEERATLVLTEEEADRGIAMIAADFDCDLEAVGHALAATSEISGALRAMAEATVGA